MIGGGVIRMILARLTLRPRIARSDHRRALIDDQEKRYLALVRARREGAQPL